MRSVKSPVPVSITLADLLAIGLLALAVWVFATGGWLLRIGGLRLSLTSGWRVLLWSAAATALRHAVFSRPSLPGRLAHSLRALAGIAVPFVCRFGRASLTLSRRVPVRALFTGVAAAARASFPDRCTLVEGLAVGRAVLWRSRVPIAAAILLVIARSAVFMWWEQAHFDSDQAIVGLMAKHLAEGRAVPVFYYGQSYMLGVEAWAAAPLFAMFGPTVLVLKLPLLLANVFVAVLLLMLLQAELSLPPWTAFAVSVFFVIAPPGTSARLLEANGGSVESFVYVLLLWTTRRWPALFGATLGFGFLHREFTLYGVLALLLMQVASGLAFSRRFVRRASAAVLAALAVWAAVYALNAYVATPYGPGTTAAGFGARTNVRDLLDRFCWSPGDLWWRLEDLRNRHVGVLFGTAAHPLWKLRIESATTWQGLVGLSVVMLTALAAVVVRLTMIARRGRPRPTAVGFAVYLILIGIISLTAVWTLGCSGITVATLRYDLLALTAPIGVAALFFALERSRWWKGGMVVALALWAVVSAVSHGRLLAEYLTHPPPNTARATVDALVAQGVRSARSRYAIAYHLTFLAQEHVVLSADDAPRITEYQARLDALGDGAEHVRPGPCPGGAYLAGDLYRCPQ